jgi:hypothetical protein
MPPAMAAALAAPAEGMTHALRQSELQQASANWWPEVCCLFPDKFATS